MPYITTIKTIEKTVKYWVPDEIIDKSHTNCGDSAYAYIAKVNKPHSLSYGQHIPWPENCGHNLVVSHEEIDERIIDPVFPKTVVNPGE